MVCNALYSVSRAARWVYQHPSSPFNLQQLAGRPLPRLHFLPRSPVYFDRHTLSLRDGVASMYTLDGRMRFNLPLAPADEQRFRTARLREIVLQRREDKFQLSFTFGEAGDDADTAVEAIGSTIAATATTATAATTAAAAAPGTEMPQHLVVLHGATQTPAAAPAPSDGKPASRPPAPLLTRP